MATLLQCAVSINAGKLGKGDSSMQDKYLRLKISNNIPI